MVFTLAERAVVLYLAAQGHELPQGWTFDGTTYLDTMAVES